MRCFFYRTADIKKSLLASFILFAALSRVAAAAENAPPTPVFTTDERIEESVPYLTLSWEIPMETDHQEPFDFELQVATAPDFHDARIRYRGPDEATFISGLPEGEYFFRVRSISSDDQTSGWSEPVYLTIKYDSLAKAFFLFGIGAVVSVATVVLVVTGDRRARREAITP